MQHHFWYLSLLVMLLLAGGCTGENETTSSSEEGPVGESVYQGSNKLRVDSTQARTYLQPGVGALPSSALPSSALPSSAFPPIPPADSLHLDTAAFSNTSYLLRQDTECDSFAYDIAKSTVGMTAAVLDLSVAMARGMLEAARATEPQRKDGRYLEWRASGNEEIPSLMGQPSPGRMDYALVLTGTKADSVTFTNDRYREGTTEPGALWVMTVTMKAPSIELENFVFYNGTSNDAGTMGSWHIFDEQPGPNFQKDNYHVDWFFLAENDRGLSFLFTNAEAKDTDGTPIKGDELHHLVEPQGEAIMVDDISAPSRTVMVVGTDGLGGRLDSTGGEPVCWDANRCTEGYGVCTIAPHPKFPPLVGEAPQVIPDGEVSSDQEGTPPLVEDPEEFPLADCIDACDRFEDHDQRYDCMDCCFVEVHYSGEVCER